MQMRFTLQTRLTADDRWTAVEAPGFGVWTTSASGTSRYVYTKRVENLLAPGAYRVAIRFRWLAASGKTLNSVRAFSPSCRQPDPRANLLVRGISVEPTADPARRLYVVLVRNNGRAAADTSSLALTIGGEPQPVAVVPPLARRRGHARPGRGPALPGGQPARRRGGRRRRDRRARRGRQRVHAELPARGPLSS